MICKQPTNFTWKKCGGEWGTFAVGSIVTGAPKVTRYFLTMTWGPPSASNIVLHVTNRAISPAPLVHHAHSQKNYKKKKSGYLSSFYRNDRQLTSQADFESWLKNEHKNRERREVLSNCSVEYEINIYVCWYIYINRSDISPLHFQNQIKRLSQWAQDWVNPFKKSLVSVFLFLRL